MLNSYALKLPLAQVDSRYVCVEVFMISLVPLLSKSLLFKRSVSSASPEAKFQPWEAIIMEVNRSTHMLVKLLNNTVLKKLRIPDFSMLFGLRLRSSRILPLLLSALIISSISQFINFSCVAHIFCFWLVPQLILLCSQGIPFYSLALTKLPVIPDHHRPVAFASQHCHLITLFALLCCVCWLHTCWAAQW